MNARGQGSRARAGVALLAMLFAASAMHAAVAATDPPAAVADAPLAAMVHLSGGPSPDFPATAAEVRAAAFDALAALSGARGRLLADRGRTEDLIRRHRIRTGSSLTTEFLADLRSETGAATLLAVGLLAEDGRLAVSVRAIDTAGGRLAGLGLGEADPTAATWRAALTEAIRQAYPEPTGTGGDAAPLLVLPARTVGLDAQVSRTATTCVLAEALAGGRWSALDPALVTGSTTAAGHDLGLLDGEGRALVARQCGVTWAVVPEVVSFDLLNEAAASREPVEADGGYRVRRVATLMVSLQLLDLRTGLVRGAVSAVFPGDPRVGWFGHVSQPTELQQIRSAAAQLWEQFQRLLEEQNS